MSDDLESQVANLTALMKQIQESMAPVQAEQHKLKDAEAEAYQEYQAKVAAIRASKKQFDDLIYETQKKINQTAYELEQAKRKLAEEKAEQEKIAKQKAAEEAFASELDRWNKLTMGAPWREFAMDHQISGAHKITADAKVIVADPMGLGKTLTAIASCDMIEAASKNASTEFPFLGTEEDVYVSSKTDPETGEFIQGHWEKQLVGGIERPVGRKILYFCPSPMIKNVEREFRLWAPHRNVTFIGGMSKAERKFVFDFVLKQHGEYVVICNYEAWRKDLSLIDSLINEQFDTIIIDEAHIIKETKSIGYRGIKRLIDELKPEYVLPMTGTPILNRPQELFALLTLVAPKEFNHLNDFLMRYCEQDWNTGFWKFKSGGLDLIAKRISKNFMRRTRDQAGIKLPPKTITIHDLEVDEEAYPNQAKVREQMKKHAMIMIDEAAGKSISAAAMIAVYTRLRQIETWPAGILIRDPKTHEVKIQVDVEESQKVDYLIKYNQESSEFEGLIPEVITDERCVVFSQFKAPLYELRERIEKAGLRAVILDGSTPPSIKDQIQLDFDARSTPDRKDSKWDIVLCNYKVGGVGMNFTCASQMFILDEEWNPGKRDQAYDRIHRIGQDKPVSIHVIRNKKTIDDWLANIMDNKEDLVTGFNDTMVKDFKAFLEGDDSGLA